MTKEKLTKKQTQILEFVVGYVREHGYPPSYREVGEHFGISSTATVHEHIKNLERKGFLRNDADAARSIEVAPALLKAAEAVLLPLKGLITAGQPIEAMETNETVSVPASLAGSGESTYVLRVKGDSMIEDGILSGDYVVVEKDKSPKNGDVVVALLENTYATLKRYYREKNAVRLQPANRTMKPIYAQDIIVQGIVRGVIRDYRMQAAL
jgi:repressor LexA